jgi:pimeloyl-ACP methyl ester carboxylesterase
LEGIYVREIEIPTTTTTTTRQTVNQTVFVQNFGLVHTQYLVDILPMLRKCLETLNIVPRTRSTRWISTACLPEQYSTPLYQTMNIDYLCKLFTTPVMLQQALTQVPRNAILIEVSPRSLMQTLLKKCLIQPTLMMNTGVNTQTVLPTIIPLMPTNTFGITGQYVLEHFLVQLGRLYLEGVEFDSIKLFVPTTLNSTVYPVPVEQRILNLFSQWNVQPEPMSYIVMRQEIGTTVEQVIMNAINSINITGDIQTVRFTVDVESLLEKESYLLNHQINGRVLYPTTGYLYLVWKALAQLRQQKTTVGPISLDSVFGLPSELEQLPPVSFENVQIHRATVLREQAQQVVIVPQNKRVLFQINYQPSTGLFEIVEGMNLIVNGTVFVPTNVDFVTPFKAQWESQVRCNLVVPQEDIYNQFKQSGYELIGEFQPIVRTNVAGTQGELLWTGKWIPFLDSMLHMNYLAQQRQQTIESTGLMLPTRIRSVRINPIEHLIRAEKYVTLPVLNDLYTNKTICGGIEITGIQLTQVVLPKDQFNPSIVTRTIANYTPVQTQVQGQVQLQRQIIRPTFVNNWTIGQTCVLNGQLTHLIIGALDCDLGLELAQWMVQYCGVRYLVLTTQRVNTVEPVVLSAQQSQRLRYLQNEFGCQIKCVSTLDLNDETECLLLVRQACRMTSHFEGKIGSIFHLGGLFVEQPQQGMTFSVKSLNHLDRYTRNQTIMPDYGLFVVFTRSTNVGQTVDIQTIMENVCESRRRECGRHALLVDLMVLLANGQQSQVPIEYKNVIVRLEQMLVQSVRVQLPIELQQLPFFNLRVQEEVVGVEQNNQMINRARRQVQERPMTLMAQKCVERLNNVECGQEQPLFVVMPIESSVSYIRTWAQQLRVPVFGVQFTQECLRFETVEQLAQFYWQQIERVVPHVEKIHLVGHTFGVPVAFEMASRRPQQVVSLCLLDSGLTQTFLNGFVFGVESVCEFDGLFKFYQQFVAPNVRLSVEQFYQMLAQMPTFDERVKFVVGKIVEQSQMTFDLVDLETAVRSYVRFMIVSCKYVPSQPLRLNRIVVVRPNIVPAIRYQPWEMIFSQQETVDQEMIEKLFQGLRQYVYGRLQVHLIDGEQNNFFMQETATRIASILNNILVAEF